MLPWLSPKILKLMRHHDRAHRTAKQQDTPDAWKRFRFNYILERLVIFAQHVPLTITNGAEFASTPI